MTEVPNGFEPPPYPYDRLEELRVVADQHDGGCVDLSVGTPTDPPPTAVLSALASSGDAHTYPRSVGAPVFREAASSWLTRRFGVTVDPDHIAACVGTKELVASLPHYLRLREPTRDTVLYPAVSYPSYEMGALLASCRAVPVPVDECWRIDLDAVDPEARAQQLRDPPLLLAVWAFAFPTPTPELALPFCHDVLRRRDSACEERNSTQRRKDAETQSYTQRNCFR